MLVSFRRPRCRFRRSSWIRDDLARAAVRLGRIDLPPPVTAVR